MIGASRSTIFNKGVMMNRAYLFGIFMLFSIFTGMNQEHGWFVRAMMLFIAIVCLKAILITIEGYIDGKTRK